MAAAQLDLVFLWHMHQPDYRLSGEFVMPWTLLHALKDYTDMAAHYERHPRIRGVVNFVPVLLEQIDDYVAQFACGEFRDPLLRGLARPTLDDLPSDQRRLLLAACFRSNPATMLAAFPHYQRLHDLYRSLARDGEATLAYLSGAYFADLLVWYLLAWTGETERRRDPLLAELFAKGTAYDGDDRRRLLAYIGRTLAGLLPRYRALQDNGQIELSTTPATHPLSPLLLDFQAARDSLPHADLPQAGAYPGGLERVRRHLAVARAQHLAHFGVPPVGLWPAEGAISPAFVAVAGEAGYRWLASGENVLIHSLGSSQTGAAQRPWRIAAAKPWLFFRNDRLSDLIGFEYARWHGRDAAAHLVGELEKIAAAATAGEIPVVAIMLDGENAWEYYPYNAFYFFDDLYTLLEQHPGIRTRTLAEQVAAASPAAVPPAPTLLKRLAAGSWVHGNFSTWIGAPAKNRAWDLLCAAKQSYDQVIASGRLSAAQAVAAEAQLARCESSDWFWWFGDYNPAPAVASFDQLFRRNLGELYRCLQLTPPADLDHPIATGRDTPTAGADAAAGGAMRRAGGPLQ